MVRERKEREREERKRREREEAVQVLLECRSGIECVREVDM